MQTAVIIIRDFKIHTNGFIQPWSYLICSLIHLHSAYPLQGSGQNCVTPDVINSSVSHWLLTFFWFYLSFIPTTFFYTFGDL